MVEMPVRYLAPHRGPAPMGTTFRGDLFLCFADDVENGHSVIQQTAPDGFEVEDAWAVFLKAMSPGHACLWLYFNSCGEWVRISRWFGGPDGGPVLSGECDGLVAMLTLHALTHVPNPPDEEF